jgi:hypothetical protein
MVSRWIASGLLWDEEGFRKVCGHQDLDELDEALSKDGILPPSKLSSA